MNLFTALLRGKAETRMSVDDYAELFAFNGTTYTLIGSGSEWNDREYPDYGFASRISSTYKANGVVFAVMLARILALSEARFQFQRMTGGRPGDLFGNADLSILERPWPNATTGELIARMEQDASFAGNAYIVNEGARLRRLRPDWVTILLSAPPAEAVHSDIIGYQYTPGGLGTAGRGTEIEPAFYLPEQVCHWSPIPDPEAQYRGMSWITAIVREIAADTAAIRHKLNFFRNGASPQLAISFNEKVTKQQFKDFMRETNEMSQGVDNAYKNLYLGGGADVTVIGKDLQQLDFKKSQGAGETRIAAAGGVPAIIVGLSEGLDSATYSNFTQARRRFADLTCRPLWRSMAASLETIVPPPPSSRLWYDDRDVPFLREDAKDTADIETQRATTIAALVAAGFEADSVVTAVMADDLSLLKGAHTGMFSVQLQPAGAPANNGNKPRSRHIVRDEEGLVVAVEER